MEDLIAFLFDKLVYIVGGVVTGGVGMALVKGRFDLRLKEMDQSAEERKQLHLDMVALELKFENHVKQYYELKEQYLTLKSQSLSQANEIKHLTNRLKELEVYKSQTKLIGQCRHELNSYYKHRDADQLIEKLAKLLME